MAVTIQSVADEAGVSAATVSRVFNDTAPVEPSTKERILEAADELGYVPNATARSLSIKETSTFGVLLPFLTGEYYPEVIRGLDQAARDHDRFLLLSSSHHTPDDLKRALRSMYGRVDGLVLMLPQLAAVEFQQNLPDDIPVVLLNCAPDRHDFPVLSVDNREGGRRATKHLIDQGHERIGILTGDPANYEARERLQGYRTAMEDANLPTNDDWIVTGDFTRSSGKTGIRKLLDVSPRPTGVFVSNDYMAMGAIQTLHDEDMHVPDEMSIVGFDDLPSAKHFTPSLTSVSARMTDLGTKAISLLMDLTDDSSDSDLSQETHTLEPLLRVRDTTSSPRQ